MDILGVVERKSIVTADLAYYYPATGKVTILIGYQWVNIPKMENSFLCPMQLWMNDVIAND